MPTGSAIFSSAYAGSVDYYAAMCRCGSVTIDPSEKVDKHSWIHNHCCIIGPNGRQTLAIPVEHATHSAQCVVREMRIAEHGGWRRVHWGAIFSAYGRTPFFEYIAPELQALYARGDHWLWDFNIELHELIVDFLDLPITTVVPKNSTASAETKVENKAETMTELNVEGVDFRPFCHEICKADSGMAEQCKSRPYYQIWTDRFGFVPGLSILDLLMNMGREAILSLR